ncbi:MAG: DNA primase [Clostridia bacterium]|nr:DNA primase [Clostridia bacterium]
MSVSAMDVINSLFNPKDIVNLRVFDDKKTGVFSGAKLSVEAGKFVTIEETLKNHNEQNRGIFFVVNYGGHDDGSITRINAQFVEVDELTFEEQQKQIEAFPLPPSMVIKTQKSLHTYWFVLDAKVEQFREIQKQLVAYFHGDPMCVNESRVMRLPGFYHCKKEPVMVECISFHPERKYTQEQLSEALPQGENAKPVEVKKGSEKGLPLLLHGCDFIKHCKANAATLSEHDWYAMITNLASFEGGTRLIHDLSSPYEGYNEQNTQKKINHFLESGTKPMNCKTIAEKGFKCPKYVSGECICKAPAAMVYQPISHEALCAMIDELEVTGNAINDMLIAKEFVENYLYNQDVVTAETIIGFKLKEHFKLKSNFIKPLLQIYKELNKEYKETKGNAKNLMSDLPDWYSVSTQGLRFLPGVLAEHMSKNEEVFYATEQFFRYTDGVYLEMSEMEAQRLVQAKMLARESKMNQIVDAEHQWRLRIQKDLRELNANPYIINVKNGLFNVLEETLTEHTPNYYSTVQLNVNYNKKADCPRFKEFLKESMGGDMEQVALIQEMLGYFLIPINSAQKCFVIVGVAGAGKSVLLRVINDILLGKKNVSNVSWQALNERFKTAELFGKLANIFADLPTKNIDDNGIFKALVGEDYLTVEKKHKNPFSFQSCARLLFSCNSIPKNYGDRSEGFYRRLIIMRFNHTVPVEKRDPDLIEKFAAEADGIFIFALEGLKRLMSKQFVFSETEVNKAELQQYREDSDSVLSFIKECCEIDSNASVGSTEIFNAYKEYCEECGLKPYSQRSFVQQISASYPSVTRGRDKLNTRRVMNGIKLTDEVF